MFWLQVIADFKTISLQPQTYHPYNIGNSSKQDNWPHLHKTCSQIKQLLIGKLVLTENNPPPPKKNEETIMP